MRQHEKNRPSPREIKKQLKDLLQLVAKIQVSAPPHVRN